RRRAAAARGVLRPRRPGVVGRAGPGCERQGPPAGRGAGRVHQTDRQHPGPAGWRSRMRSRYVLPARLLAPGPGWTARADVVVVGSGIAGLTVALAARESGHTVLLVTKALMEAGSTRWA